MKRALPRGENAFGAGLVSAWFCALMEIERLGVVAANMPNKSSISVNRRQELKSMIGSRAGVHMRRRRTLPRTAERPPGWGGGMTVCFGIALERRIEPFAVTPNRFFPALQGMGSEALRAIFGKQTAYFVGSRANCLKGKEKLRDLSAAAPPGGQELQRGPCRKAGSPVPGTLAPSRRGLITPNLAVIYSRPRIPNMGGQQSRLP